MLNKNRATHTLRPVAIVTTSYQNALDILDYTFASKGYIYHFGTYWNVFQTK